MLNLNLNENIREDEEFIIESWVTCCSSNLLLVSNQDSKAIDHLINMDDQRSLLSFQEGGGGEILCSKSF